MQPMTLEFRTRRLAESQDEYHNLDILDYQDPNDPTTNTMYSYWQPSPEELEILNNGGYVQLGILGTSHPPVSVQAHKFD